MVVFLQSCTKKAYSAFLVNFCKNVSELFMSPRRRHRRNKTVIQICGSIIEVTIFSY